MNYDWEMDIYAKGKQINKWPYSEVVSEMKRIYPDGELKGKEVVEIGCGTGNNLLFLASEGCKVTGFEYSHTAIQLAENLLACFGYEANLLTGDVTQSLPWEDESFDIVLDRGCLTQVSHIHLKSVLAEIYRILKPGGHFFSFTLFGQESTDLDSGMEIHPNTYNNFTKGYFSKIGLTSVFDEPIITELWKPLKLIKCYKNTQSDQIHPTKLVTYTVISKK